MIEELKPDTLSYDVWNTKYRYNNETWNEFLNRISKSFHVNFTNLNDEQYKNLSDLGKTYFNDINLINNTIDSYIKNLTIIPGGSVLTSVGTNKLCSLSNCFVVDVKDSIEGIMNTARKMSEIYKRRGGCGLDLSPLRPNGATVNNSNGTSTGVVPFMELFSQITQTVSSGNRRGALMLCLDINHPDILEFIESKQDLTKITGANISIKTNAEFMKAVENNEDYILKWPCDDNSNLTFYDNEYNILIKHTKINGDIIYTKKIKAKELWNKFVQCAWNTAEPGILFWDNILNNDMANPYPEFRTIATNPCGEITLSESDSCRLIAVNLYNLVKNKFNEDSEIVLNDVYKVFYIAQIIGDRLVDLELNAVKNIINNTSNSEKELWKHIYEIGKNGRRTGVGFTGYADMLAALNKQYGDVSITKAVMRTMMRAELDATIDLAIINGAFPAYNINYEITNNNCINNIYNFIKEEFPEQYERMNKFGRRNISLSTVAPTGSISLLVNNLSSGLEPEFSLFYSRRKKCLDGEIPDFIDQNGIGFKTYPVISGAFIDWLKNKNYYKENLQIKELENYAKISPWHNNCANDIDPLLRVRLQGLIQKYITHSISSTVNLPEETTKEEIEKLYIEAYKNGCKGQTNYRNNCRAGILIKKDSSKKEEVEKPKLDYIKPITRNNFGEVLFGQTFKFKTACGTLYVTINKDENGNIVEIFTNSSKNGTCKANLNGETRMASLALRAGVKVNEVIDQLKGIHCQSCAFAKAKGNQVDGTSCPDIISKAISKCYNSNLEKTKWLKTKLSEKDKCPECGSTLTQSGGCNICQNCGYSKCG